MRIRLLLLCAALAAALVAAPAAGAYGWPVKPFDQEHAVRAAFGDPRLEGPSLAFHFGVDVVAADGTEVYAVAPGTAFVYRDRVAVRGKDGHTFGYWHIDPVVKNHTRIRLHQLLGTVIPGWGHVHFAERDAHGYLNPLRPGALSPWLDFSSPTITRITFSRENRAVSASRVSGVVDVEAGVYDTPPVAFGGPWSGALLSPALLRWDVLRGGEQVVRWRTPVDFRLRLPPRWRFTQIYAPGTHENRAGRPGRYRYYLARGLDTTCLPDGSYQLDVQAVDASGNEAVVRLPFRVANAPHPPATARPGCFR